MLSCMFYLENSIKDPKEILEAQCVLSYTILPWAPNENTPPQFIRVDGLGRRVAIVTSRLGGYGDVHDATDGWGYKSCPSGQGHVTSGIVPSREEAMAIVDKFLSKYFPGLILLEGEEDHMCYGTLGGCRAIRRGTDHGHF